MKKAIRVLVVVILATAAFGVTIATYGDTMVTDAVNRMLSKALAPGGEVEKVHVGLFSGELTLQNLRILNPKGFRSNEMLSLGSAFARVSLRELLDKKLTIEELQVKDLTFRLERSGFKTNVTEAFKVKRKERSSPANPQPPGEKKPLDVTISRITVENVKFFAPKIAESKPLEMERLVLKGPFRLENGRGLEKVLNALADELKKEAVREGAKALTNPEEARKKLEKGIKTLKKLFGK